jgi:hypothetical protein
MGNFSASNSSSNYFGEGLLGNAFSGGASIGGEASSFAESGGAASIFGDLTQWANANAFGTYIAAANANSGVLGMQVLPNGEWPNWPDTDIVN